MKHGLVLEGGGMRGMFTTGVLDVMLENGINMDGVMGVSAGALFGVNYVSKQVGRALRYNIALKDDPRYMSLRSLFKTGDLVGAEFAYHIVPFEIDIFDFDTFKSNPTEFWVVCTDVKHGVPVYHHMKEFTHHELDWLRASGSMPVASRVVELDGYALLDGGMTDSIPLRAFQEKGYECNIVVLTQPLGYRKHRSTFNKIFRLFHRNYPQVAEIMERRPDMYNAQLDYIQAEAAKGNTLLIYPEDKLDIGRTELNEEKMRAIYQQGRQKAMLMLDQIREFACK